MTSPKPQTSPPPSRVLCARQSAERGEPIEGSATASVRAWIVLQVQQPWARKAWPKVTVPDAVRAHIDAALAATEGSRLQLVRRPTREDDGSVRVMVGRSDGAIPWLATWTFDSYDGILALDLKGLLAHTRAPDGVALSEPVWLICTHGTRDRCCARLGAPVERALRGAFGARVWGASHVGGHRFAPNVLALPYGALLGRLPAPPDDAMLDALAHGRLPGLAYYRGRTCWSGPEQAAESYARAHTGHLDLGGVDVVSCAPRGDDLWEARVAVEGRGVLRVAVTRALMPAPQLKSCDDAAPKPVAHFALVGDVTEEPASP